MEHAMRDDLKEIANKLGDREGGVVMDGVREYNEGMPVYFAPTEDANRTGETRAAERAGRFVLEAFNEAGHNSVAIDVEDALVWVMRYRPTFIEPLLLQGVPGGYSDPVYCAIGRIVAAIALVDERGDKGSPLRTCLEGALTALSPMIFAEVQADGAATVHAERWEGTIDGTQHERVSRRMHDRYSGDR